MKLRFPIFMLLILKIKDIGNSQERKKLKITEF